MKLDPSSQAHILQLYHEGQTDSGSVSLFKTLRTPLHTFFMSRLRYSSDARVIADDLVQETLLRVHQALTDKRREADPILSLDRFISTCAKRVLADAWRHTLKMATAQAPIDIDDLSGPSVEMALPTLSSDVSSIRRRPLTCLASPERVLERQERTAAVDDCLEKLPNPRHRACLLDWLHGLPLREIARRHDYQDTNGSTTAKDTAKRLLIQCLEGKGFEVRLP